LHFQQARFGRTHAWIVRRFYRHADLVVANSRGAAVDLTCRYGLPQARVRVLHNPIDIARIRWLADEPMETAAPSPGRPYVLAVGRFVFQKDHDLLIRAFARVRKSVDCALVLMGAGPLRGALEQRARGLGLQLGHDIVFLGQCRNPYPYMKRAALFALSSRFEGFPNALLEAMACGSPVVATRCRSGPEELLDGGRNGLLAAVGDSRDLADKIVTVMQNRALAAGLTRRGTTEVERYDVDKIVPQYEDLFSKLAGL
jgi:glycosyltransferase involved in cell wall biosynthesis